MLKVAAFADEISPDLHEQIRVCKENGVSQIELRGVNQLNVLDMDDQLCKTVKHDLASAGLSVVSIGSPIGKIKITDPFEPHFERFKIAVARAEFFNAPFIRIFSYYPSDEHDNILHHRDEVMRRMHEKVNYVQNRNVVLVHENERHIYGEKGAQCLDLMQTINSPKLRNAFDFANFVVAGQDPMECWPDLKPYTVHIHIKDALLDSGKIVPAGHGDGHIGEILKDAWQSGYRGALSLEPHLSAAGQFRGFSGPALFKQAADALKAVCAQAQVPLAV